MIKDFTTYGPVLSGQDDLNQDQKEAYVRRRKKRQTPLQKAKDTIKGLVHIISCHEATISYNKGLIETLRASEAQAGVQRSRAVDGICTALYELRKVTPDERRFEVMQRAIGLAEGVLSALDHFGSSASKQYAVRSIVTDKKTP